MGAVLTAMGAAIAHGADEWAPAREIAGAAELAPGRVLAWGTVADGQEKDELFLFENDTAAKFLNRAPAQVAAVATGRGLVVYVVGGRVHRAPVDRPQELTAMPVAGEWEALAYGARGFVLGGSEDALAYSADGITWRALTVQKKNHGRFAQIVAGTAGYAALRQTSSQGDGWNANVSELWFSPDGVTWANVHSVSGNAYDTPLQRLQWVSDRWITLAPYNAVLSSVDGRAWVSHEGVLPKGFPELTGREPVGRAEWRWLLIHEDNIVMESADLTTWKERTKLGTDTKGIWMNDSNGSLRFVGHTSLDWTRSVTLALGNFPAAQPKVVAAPAVAAKPAAPVTAPPVASPPAAKPAPKPPVEASPTAPLAATFDAAGKLVLPAPRVRTESPEPHESTLRKAWAAAPSQPNPGKHRGQALTAYYTAVRALNLPKERFDALMTERIDELAQIDFFALMEAQWALPTKEVAGFRAQMTAPQRMALHHMATSIVSDYTQGKKSASPSGGWAEPDMRGYRAALQQNNPVLAAEWLRKAANKGDVSAMALLADAYRAGAGVAKDPVQALLWTRRAAEKGHAESAQALASAYREGVVVAKEESLAANWSQRGTPAKPAGTGLSADAGSLMLQAYAAIQAGKTLEGVELLEQAIAAGKKANDANVVSRAGELMDIAADQLVSDGVDMYQKKDYAKARAFLERAANLGSGEAMFNLGRLYSAGEGVPADAQQAFAWTKKSAEDGFARGMALTGLYYAEGTGVAANPEQAKFWLEKAVKLKLPEGLEKMAREQLAALSPKEPVTAGDFFNVGLQRYKQGDRTTAESHWLKAAELGNAPAMFNLSILYEAGEYGRKADLGLAQAWAEKAAAAGYSEVVEALKPSADLTAGRAAAKAGDWIGARKAFEKGAEAGNASAINELARLHAEGIAVLPDEKKALELYKKASALGSSWADRRIKAIERGYTVRAELAKHREHSRLRDSVNANFSGEAAVKERAFGTTTQAEIDALIKRSPWTAEEITAAVKKGVKPDALAVVLRTDGGDFYETDRVRILNLPELAGIGGYSEISLELTSQEKDGAGPWARELAAKAVAARKAQLGVRTFPADTAELRARAEAGQLDAIYDYYRMPEAALKLGKLPVAITRQYADLKTRVLAEKFVRGYWMLAADLKDPVDHAKVDRAKAAAYDRAAAEAGEAAGALGLAEAFGGYAHYKTNEFGVTPNFLAAEHWFIEAAALTKPGERVGYYSAEDALYALYSFSRPTGGKGSTMFVDEPSLRWARELIRRGGKTAEVTLLKLDGLRREHPEKKLDEVLAAIPPEVPAWGAAKLSGLEAEGKRGDTAALLTLGDAYAAGRGVMQDDAKALDYFRQAAEKGSAAAMLRIDERIEKGYGARPDVEQRIVWLRRASDAGDITATKKLAGLLQGAEGIALYEKAAAAGDADALFFISDIYQYGRKVPADEAKFIDYATRAAKAGSVRAMERLGFFYDYTKKDTATSVVWYRQAVAAGEKNSRRALATGLDKTGDKDGAAVLWREMAEEGSVLAQLKTGFYLQSKGDEDGAVVWFRKAAASPRSEHQEMAVQLVRSYDEEANAKPGTIPYYRKRARAGDNEARFELARLLAGTNKKEAIDWLRAAADEGHAQATALYIAELAKTDKPGALAWLKAQADTGNTQAAFMLGMQTAATDKPAGLALIERAVAAGNLEAKFSYGMMQYQGREVPQDRASAIKLITEAANGGFPAAQATLGKALVTGDVGIDVDAPRGLAYLKKAAEQSVYVPVAAQAAVLLGQIYERGVGTAVKPEPATALEFYTRARQLGAPNLNDTINRLSREHSMKMKGM